MVHEEFKTLRRQAGFSQMRLCRKAGGFSRFRLSLFEAGYETLSNAELEMLRRALRDLAEERLQEMSSQLGNPR